MCISTHFFQDMSQEEVSAEEGDLQFVSDISDSNSDDDDDDPPEDSKHSTPRPQLRQVMFVGQLGLQQ